MAARTDVAAGRHHLDNYRYNVIPYVRGPVGSYPDFLDWRAQAQSFQRMAALDLPSFLAHLTSDLNARRGPNSLLTDDITLVVIALSPDALSDV
jgi:hypothetical protein